MQSYSSISPLNSVGLQDPSPALITTKHSHLLWRLVLDNFTLFLMALVDESKFVISLVFSISCLVFLLLLFTALIL